MPTPVWLNCESTIDTVYPSQLDPRRLRPASPHPPDPEVVHIPGDQPAHIRRHALDADRSLIDPRPYRLPQQEQLGSATESSSSVHPAAHPSSPAPEARTTPSKACHGRRCGAAGKNHVCRRGAGAPYGHSGGATSRLQVESISSSARHSQLVDTCWRLLLELPPSPADVGTPFFPGAIAHERRRLLSSVFSIQPIRRHAELHNVHLHHLERCREHQQRRRFPAARLRFSIDLEASAAPASY